MEFKRLDNRVQGWSQKALVGSFMGGLKPEIADEIRFFQPEIGGHQPAPYKRRSVRLAEAVYPNRTTQLQYTDANPNNRIFVSKCSSAKIDQVVV